MTAGPAQFDTTEGQDAMHVVFLFPLAFGLFATFMVLIGDSGNLLKWIVASVYLTSVSMQFVPILRDSIHFLIPMFLQIGLCLWYMIAGKYAD